MIKKIKSFLDELFLSQNTKDILLYRKNIIKNINDLYLQYSESSRGKKCIITDNLKTISYSYQRHDLNVTSHNPLLFLYNYKSIVSNQALLNSHMLFFSSGMASISTILMTLKQNYNSILFSDIPYFESYDYAQYIKFNCSEYKNNNDYLTDILWICSASYNFKSIDYKNIQCKIIVFDTSCLDCSHKYIHELITYCLNRNICLILVRSHIKIDCFGLEINRLGSALIINDDNDYSSRCREVRKYLGNNVEIRAIYPWLGYNKFFDITTFGYNQVVNIYHKVVNCLNDNLNNEKYEVIYFDHEVYVNIKVKDKSINLDIINQNIIKHCNDPKINTLSSFYMYSIGLDNFVRVLDNNNQFLRISLSIYVDENKTLYLINKIIDYLNNL